MIGGRLTCIEHGSAASRIPTVLSTRPLSCFILLQKRSVSTTHATNPQEALIYLITPILPCLLVISPGRPFIATHVKTSQRCASDAVRPELVAGFPLQLDSSYRLSLSIPFLWNVKVFFLFKFEMVCKSEDVFRGIA